VLNNPGFPDAETIEIKDYINKDVGFVAAQIKSKLSPDKKYIKIESREGKYYFNAVTLNADDLSTVSERRYDVNGKLIESFTQNGDQVSFFHKQNKIDLKTTDCDKIYSRYAFVLSLRGFPFNKERVSFKTYMFEYGNYLIMDVENKGKVKVKVPAGEFECYKLEIGVGGWQKVFAPDKYYLYFKVEKPHVFVKFEQKIDTGVWLSNELVKYTPNK